MGAPRSKHCDLPARVQVKTRGTHSYYYYREQLRDGGERRFALQGAPYRDDGVSDPDWWAAYNALKSGSGEHRREDPIFRGSVAELIAEYQASPAFADLSPRTQSEWRRHLDRIELEWGSILVAGIRKKDVFGLRDKFSSKPAETNNMLRALSSMLTWATAREWLAHNPCLNLKGLMYKAQRRYAPWSWEHIHLLEREAAPHLWWIAAVALYTGQRLADCLKMKWADESAGSVAVRQRKTAKQLWIPMHRDLQALWDQLPRKSEYVLTGKRSLGWTEGGFQTVWRKQLMNEALQPIKDAGLVFHGLRKSAVVMLLEAGCTDAEVAAITGHSRDMVDYYAIQVNQRKLASTAMAKWEAVVENQRTFD